MKGRNLFILVVVAAVLVVLAIRTSDEGRKATPAAIGSKIMANLPVNDVEKIVVRSEKESLTVAKVEGTWVLPSRYSFPANFTKVKDVLMRLTDLKVGQVIQAGESQRAALKMIVPPAAPAPKKPAIPVAPPRPAATNAAAGLTNASSATVEPKQEPEPESRAGVLVSLLGRGDKQIAGLLLGESRRRKPAQGEPDYFGDYPDGRYVSPDGGKNVYLVAGSLDEFSMKPPDWMDKEVVYVLASDVTEVTIASPTGQVVRLARPKSGERLAVQGLAPNEEEVVSSKINDIESALSYLRFEDIADPALPGQKTGMDKPVVFRVVTVKDQIYTVRIGNQTDDKSGRYVRFDAALKKAEAPAKPASTNAAAKPPEFGPAAERAANGKDVKELNDRISKWTYIIGTYKTDIMSTPRDTLVKKKEEPKKEEGVKSKKKKEEPEKQGEETKAPGEKKKKKWFFF